MRSQLANLVTISRVILVLPFWLALERPGLPGAVIAVVCATLMELSDFFDGRVARHLGVVSETGKLLDPAADSFSRLSVFLALATHPAPGPSEPWFPAGAVVFLLLRDVGVSFVRQVSAARGVVVAARASGKIKAVVQALAIWTILGLHLDATLSGAIRDGARTVAAIACWVTVAVTLGSLVDYARGAMAPPSSGSL